MSTPKRELRSSVAAGGRAGGSPESRDGTAFGAENRARLIATYLESVADEPVTPATAWRHVYRLLLWVDDSTGLAHCYESDKCQPGKPWYGRSLAFHAWLTSEFGRPPRELAQHIDWMFQRAVLDLAQDERQQRGTRRSREAEQFAPYAGRDFPQPGEDPRVEAIIYEVLRRYLREDPSPEDWRTLTKRVYRHLNVDNKRKNLLGEGFEDVLAAMIRACCPSIADSVGTQQVLQDLRGFNRVKDGEKLNKVDVAIIRPEERILVTAKWSVRADREKQFAADLADYVLAEAIGQPFEYVLITNEFDPARLRRACEKLDRNAPMFSHVVHVNTDALVATYGVAPNMSMKRVLQYIRRGRLLSLETWLQRLSNLS